MFFFSFCSRSAPQARTCPNGEKETARWGNISTFFTFQIGSSTHRVICDGARFNQPLYTQGLRVLPLQQSVSPSFLVFPSPTAVFHDFHQHRTNTLNLRNERATVAAGHHILLKNTLIGLVLPLHFRAHGFRLRDTNKRSVFQSRLVKGAVRHLTGSLFSNPPTNPTKTPAF